MRYVKLSELVAMPPGTVFSTYEPCIVNELNVMIGPNTVMPDCDFWYVPLIAFPDFNDPPDPAQGGDKDHPLLVHADAQQRWALYNKDEEFVVYEQADIDRLVKMLTGRHTEVVGS